MVAAGSPWPDDQGLGVQNRAPEIGIKDWRAGISIKWYGIDISLQKSENCLSLIRMPDRTLSMATAMISGAAGRFGLPMSIGPVELRIEADRALFDPLPGEGPP